MKYMEHAKLPMTAVYPGGEREKTIKDMQDAGYTGTLIRHLYKRAYGHAVSLHKLTCVRHGLTQICEWCQFEYYPNNASSKYCNCRCRDAAHSERLIGNGGCLVQEWNTGQMELELWPE